MSSIPPSPADYAKIYHGSKRNAQNRNIPFTLTRQQFNELVERAAGRCMVSGIPFDVSPHPEASRRPFAPSLDRIDSGSGYRCTNVRLICVMANLALNEWGLDALLRLSSNLIAHQNELIAIEHDRCKRRAIGFVTVREYLDSVNAVYDSRDLAYITRLAKRLCDSEGVEWIWVVRDTQRVRKDGTPCQKTWAAFPEGVLAHCVTVSSDE